MVESNKKDALGMTCLGQLIERQDATIDSNQRDPDNVYYCSLSFSLCHLSLHILSHHSTLKSHLRAWHSPPSHPR
jgi:hypothetical protein